MFTSIVLELTILENIVTLSVFEATLLVKVLVNTFTQELFVINTYSRCTLSVSKFGNHEASMHHTHCDIYMYFYCTTRYI